MNDALWRTVYEFYADTFHRHGHEPYLNLQFLQAASRAAHARAADAQSRAPGREPIAVAIFFVGEDALFGRYWGAGGNYHSLHFETCYYQGIEYCIEQRTAALRTRHAGRAQGAARLRADAHRLGALHRR